MKKTGIELITQERKEQIEKHLWDKDHDASCHIHGELAKVAAVLAVVHTDAKVIDPDGFQSFNNVWGLELKLANDHIHRLKVAGALIAAEIDRLQYED